MQDPFYFHNPSEDDLLFTYVLVSGILLRFQSAREYNRNDQLVTDVLRDLTIGGVRPRHTDYQNRNQLQRIQVWARYKLGIHLENPTVRRNVADHPVVQLWKQRFIDYLHRSNTDFWKIWVRDGTERRQVRMRMEVLEEQQFLESRTLETPDSIQS